MGEIPVVLESGGWLSAEGNPGAPRFGLGAVQVCHARVGAGLAERRFTIFFRNAQWSALLSTPDTFDAIAAAHSGTPVFYSDASGEDEARIDSTRPGDLEAVAAAGAVMRASWAWDERPVIPVVVNGCRHAYQPRFDGRTWLAAPAG